MKLAVVSYRHYFVPEVFQSDRPEFPGGQEHLFPSCSQGASDAESGIELVHCDDAAPEDVWGYVFINHNGKYLENLNGPDTRDVFSSSFLNRLSSSPTTGFLKFAAGTVPFFLGESGRRFFGTTGTLSVLLAESLVPGGTASSFLRKEKTVCSHGGKQVEKTAERAVHGAFPGDSLIYEAPSPKILISTAMTGTFPLQKSL